jgi:hypothetical protein
MTTPDRSVRARLASAALVLALVVGACGAETVSPSPSPTMTDGPARTDAPAPTTTPVASPVDADAVYDEIEQQVIAIRGLEPKQDVERRTIDPDELAELIAGQIDEEYPAGYLPAVQRLYVALGLIPEGDDLEALLLELLSGGVAGFYRPDEDTLYVVSKTGALGGNEKITFAHEFQHALQDQHFTVFTDQDKVLDQTDWLLARQAVYEGDATLLMSLWAGQHFTPEDMADVLQAGNDPEQAAMLARMPAILRETLLFPYTTGMAFAQSTFVQGGWQAVDALFEDLPVSTEQILHPEKWAAREAPIDVALPEGLAGAMGDGWTLTLEDSWGELQTRIWLQEGGLPTAEANEAAAGWGGDRLGVLEGPDGGWAVVLATEWDSAADAAQFEAAASTALSAAAGRSQVLPGMGGTARWVLVASDDAVLSQVAGALGLAG